MRNTPRSPVRLVDADTRTPAPVIESASTDALISAGDALMRAGMDLVRAVERRDFDHLSPEASPELQALLAARRNWLRTCVRRAQGARS
jgi:glutaredoxin 2